MNFFDKLAMRFGSKASAGRMVSTQMQVGQAIQTPANYESFARKGYSKNVFVYVCISKIARACAGIDWELYSKRKGAGARTEIETAPLLDLLEQPNPMQARAAFIESMVAYYLLTGNSYVEKVSASLNGVGVPVELWTLRPDRMTIVGGANGYPASYKFKNAGNEKTWPVDSIKMTSDILHMKSFNPVNDWYGLSPLEVAMLSVDQLNAGAVWNLALLQNSATPSGVLQMQSTNVNPRGEITAEQYERLKNEFAESYQGARNTGKPMLLEGGLVWSQMSLAPKEMDFLAGREVTSTDIARVYGVPGEIVGLGKTIYNNYQEARLAFYEDTVFPLMDFIKGELNREITPLFGEGQELDYDKDDVEAMQYKRSQKFATVAPVTFLTQNEKREACGYDEQEGWDVYAIPSTIKLGETPDEFAVAAPEPIDPNAGKPAATDPNADPSKKPDPKKPEPDMPVMDDESMSTDGKSASGFLEFKAFNLLNRVEKESTWRKVNSHKDRLTKSLSRDIQSDFKELGVKIAEAMKSSKDHRVIEFAIHKAIGDNSIHLKRTLQKHARRALEDFGGAILNQAQKEMAGRYIEKKASRKFDSFVNSYIDQHTGAAISHIDGTTTKQVMRLVSKYTEQAIADSGNDHYSLSDYADDMQSDFDELSRGRANTIARTETGAAASRGSLEAAKALEVPNLNKEWVSADDDRVRDGAKGGADHVDANGQVQSVDEPFQVPPDASMDCPLDPAGGADQVCNCRCVLVYKAGKE